MSFLEAAGSSNHLLNSILVLSYLAIVLWGVIDLVRRGGQGILVGAGII